MIDNVLLAAGFIHYVKKVELDFGERIHKLSPSFF